MLVPSKPDSGNSRFAAARIAARFSRSLGRPGPQVFATANVIGALLALDAVSGFIYYTDRYMNSVSAPRAQERTRSSKDCNGVREALSCRLREGAGRESGGGHAAGYEVATR